MAIDGIDPNISLVAEQFSHAVDLLKAADDDQRKDIKALKEQAKDFEDRIRSLTEAATQFKLLSYLAMGGGGLGLLDLIRALIAK